jgi:hypothetical protein
VQHTKDASMHVRTQMGGALHLDSSSLVSMDRCKFDSCFADLGGAVRHRHRTREEAMMNTTAKETHTYLND